MLQGDSHDDKWIREIAVRGTLPRYVDASFILYSHGDKSRTAYALERMKRRLDMLESALLVGIEGTDMLYDGGGSGNDSGGIRDGHKLAQQSEQLRPAYKNALKEYDTCPYISAICYTTDHTTHIAHKDESYGGCTQCQFRSGAILAFAILRNEKGEIYAPAPRNFSIEMCLPEIDDDDGDDDTAAPVVGPDVIPKFFEEKGIQAELEKIPEADVLTAYCIERTGAGRISDLQRCGAIIKIAKAECKNDVLLKLGCYTLGGTTDNASKIRDNSSMLFAACIAAYRGSILTSVVPPPPTTKKR